MIQLKLVRKARGNMLAKFIPKKVFSDSAEVFQHASMVLYFVDLRFLLYISR